MKRILLTLALVATIGAVTMHPADAACWYNGWSWHCWHPYWRHAYWGHPWAYWHHPYWGWHHHWHHW